MAAAHDEHGPIPADPFERAWRDAARLVVGYRATPAQEVLVARTSVIDAHTHIYRTQEIGRQAMTSLNPDIQWNGTPEELRSCMAAFGIARSVGLVVTPTREMREKAVAGLPAGLPDTERR